MVHFSMDVVSGQYGDHPLVIGKDNIEPKSTTPTTYKIDAGHLRQEVGDIKVTRVAKEEKKPDITTKGDAILWGKVTTSKGKPLSKVKVTWAGHTSKETNDEGLYEIGIDKKDFGSSKVTATTTRRYGDYESDDEVVINNTTIDANKRIEHSFEMPSKGGAATKEELLDVKRYPEYEQEDEKGGFNWLPQESEKSLSVKWASLHSRKLRAKGPTGAQYTRIVRVDFLDKDGNIFNPELYKYITKADTSQPYIYIIPSKTTEAKNLTPNQWNGNEVYLETKGDIQVNIARKADLPSKVDGEHREFSIRLRFKRNLTDSDEDEEKPTGKKEVEIRLKLRSQDEAKKSHKTSLRVIK